MKIGSPYTKVIASILALTICLSNLPAFPNSEFITSKILTPSDLKPRYFGNMTPAFARSELRVNELLGKPLITDVRRSESRSSEGESNSETSFETRDGLSFIGRINAWQLKYKKIDAVEFDIQGRHGRVDLTSSALNLSNHLGLGSELILNSKIGILSGILKQALSAREKLIVELVSEGNKEIIKIRSAQLTPSSDFPERAVREAIGNKSYHDDPNAYRSPRVGLDKSILNEPEAERISLTSWIWQGAQTSANLKALTGLIFRRLPANRSIVIPEELLATQKPFIVFLGNDKSSIKITPKHFLWMKWLRVHYLEGFEKNIRLGSGMIFGRTLDPQRIPHRLRNEKKFKMELSRSVSGVHAYVQYLTENAKRVILITDLNSSTGTWIAEEDIARLINARSEARNHSPDQTDINKGAQVSSMLSQSRAEARENSEGSKNPSKRQLRGQYKLTRAELEEQKRKSRRRFLVAAGLGAAGIIGGSTWYVISAWTERKPWHYFDIHPDNPDSDKRMREVREALLLTLDWMIDNRYPDSEILQRHAERIRNSRIEEVTKTGFLMGKGTEDGMLKINSRDMGRFLLVLKELDSPDLFAELTFLIGREAWGFEMLPFMSRIRVEQKFVQRGKQLVDAQRRFTGTEKLKLENKGMRKFLDVYQDEISDLTALLLSFEAYETLREDRVIHWAIDNRLYDPEKANQTVLRVQEKGINVGSFLGIRHHFDTLLESGGNLDALLKMELGVYLAQVFTGRVRDVSSVIYAFYAFLELKRFEDTNGKEGLDPDRITASREGQPLLIDASALRLRSRVLEILSELEKDLPKGQKIFSGTKGNVRSEARVFSIKEIAESTTVNLAQVKSLLNDHSQDIEVTREASPLELQEYQRSQRYIVRIKSYDVTFVFDSAQHKGRPAKGYFLVIKKIHGDNTIDTTSLNIDGDIPKAIVSLRETLERALKTSRSEARNNFKIDQREIDRARAENPELTIAGLLSSNFSLNNGKLSGFRISVRPKGMQGIYRIDLDSENTQPIATIVASLKNYNINSPSQIESISGEIRSEARNLNPDQTDVNKGERVSLAQARAEARSEEPAYFGYRLVVPEIHVPGLLSGETLVRSQSWKDISEMMILHAMKNYNPKTVKGTAFVVVIRPKDYSQTVMVLSHKAQIMNDPDALRELFYDASLAFENETNQRIVRADLIDGGYQMLDFVHRGDHNAHILIVDVEIKPIPLGEKEVGSFLNQTGYFGKLGDDGASLGRSEARGSWSKIWQRVGLKGVLERWWQKRRERKIDTSLDRIQELFKSINVYANLKLDDELQLKILRNNREDYLGPIDVALTQLFLNGKLTPAQMERARAFDEKYKRYAADIEDLYMKILKKRDRSETRAGKLNQVDLMEMRALLENRNKHQKDWIRLLHILGDRLPNDAKRTAANLALMSEGALTAQDVRSALEKHAISYPIAKMVRERKRGRAREEWITYLKGLVAKLDAQGQKHTIQNVAKVAGGKRSALAIRIALNQHDIYAETKILRSRTNVSRSEARQSVGNRDPYFYFFNADDINLAREVMMLIKTGRIDQVEDEEHIAKAIQVYLELQLLSEEDLVHALTNMKFSVYGIANVKNAISDFGTALLKVFYQPEQAPLFPQDFIFRDFSGMLEFEAGGSLVRVRYKDLLKKEGRQRIAKDLNYLTPEAIANRKANRSEARERVENDEFEDSWYRKPILDKKLALTMPDESELLSTAKSPASKAEIHELTQIKGN